MFKFSNVCQSPERFKTQLLRDVAGKTPSDLKKKKKASPETVCGLIAEIQVLR